MNKAFLESIYLAHQKCSNCPSQKEVSGFFDRLLGIMFPNFSSHPIKEKNQVEAQFDALKIELKRLLGSESETSDTIVDDFFNALPLIYTRLQHDVDALYQGDPAAKTREEVIRSYPGFLAIAAYRIAHELYTLEVPILPRSITEYAHSITGIDIHPGAHIGERFFIDHGTGVVIGETTVIGDDVKIYQGVTLGALSVDKILSNVKRHPTIGDKVIIYSGATILGGDTVIGEESVIGGNVWLTSSVPKGSKVYYQPTITNQESRDSIIIKNA
ncbi:serine O-acetyltransferase EpsC [Ekhidna sp.]|uniref:serine O-acetyltransferase EpsC n=1 Tax=Ekhidna sp. TaxID=2608089 RepID=UPI003C7B06D2